MYYPIVLVGGPLGKQRRDFRQPFPETLTVPDPHAKAIYQYERSAKLLVHGGFHAVYRYVSTISMED